MDSKSKFAGVLVFSIYMQVSFTAVGHTDPTDRNEGSLDCLVWEDFRADIRESDQQIPVPRLPSPYSKGCVYGYVDGHSDILVVYPEGKIPWSSNAKPSGQLLQNQRALYNVVPLPPFPRVGRLERGTLEVARIRDINAGVRDWILESAWSTPYIYDGAVSAGTYRTVTIEAPDLSEEELLDALESLKDSWQDE